MARARPTSTKRQREFDKKRKKQEKLEKKRNKEFDKEKNILDLSIYKKNIGKQVISLDFGAGVISSIETLDSNSKEKFYVVECGSKKLKNFFPVKGNKSLRFITPERELLKIFNSLKEIDGFCKIFESKKERLEYFKSSLQLHDLELLAKRIIELSNVEDLSPIEKKILDKLIKSLELEVFMVLNLKRDNPSDSILNFVEQLACITEN